MLLFLREGRFVIFWLFLLHVFWTMKLFDISCDIMHSRLYPGTVPPRVVVLSEIDASSPYRVSSLCADLHTGTHIDAPLHCFPDGKGIVDIPLDRFWGRCIVVERNGCGTPLQPASDGVGIVLFKGCREFPLSEADCRSVVDGGYCTVGCDDITVGAGDGEYVVHRFLLGAGIPVIEGLCLRDVVPGVYWLSALPVKIDGAEASFCRAILMALD